MSTAEIKRTLEQMTPDERFFAASYLTVLMHRDDPEYRTMLAERMARMDAGKKVSFEELLEAHAALEAKGL
jgi:hypothetical protein